MSNTEAGNKLIAEFMGCYPDRVYWGNEPAIVWGFKDTHITERWSEHHFDDRTPYHTSWDWLMPVVEKIAEYDYGDGDTAWPRTFGMRIQHEDGWHFMVRFNRCPVFTSKVFIEAVYNAVVDFIQYLSNTNSKPGEAGIV